MAEEQRESQELLLHTEKRCDEKVSQLEVELALVRAKYQNQVRLLGQEKEEAECSLIELRCLLNCECATGKGTCLQCSSRPKQERYE